MAMCTNFWFGGGDASPKLAVNRRPGEQRFQGTASSTSQSLASRQRVASAVSCLMPNIDRERERDRLLKLPPERLWCQSTFASLWPVLPPSAETPSARFFKSPPFPTFISSHQPLNRIELGSNFSLAKKVAVPHPLLNLNT